MKKLIAVAVASAFVAPAAFAEVTIYGSIRSGLSFVSQNDGYTQLYANPTTLVGNNTLLGINGRNLTVSTAAATAGTIYASGTGNLRGMTPLGTTQAYTGYKMNTRNQFRVTDEGSRIGFEGSDKLSNDLSVIWRVESAVRAGYNTDNLVGNGVDFAGRETWLGLKSKKFGEVRLARRMDDAYNLGSVVSPLKSQSETIKIYTGAGTIGRMSGEKINNGIDYKSPEWAGFKFGLGWGQVGVTGAKNNEWDQQTHRDQWTANLIYTHKYFEAGLTYRQINDQFTDLEHTTATGTGAHYTGTGTLTGAAATNAFLTAATAYQATTSQWTNYNAGSVGGIGAAIDNAGGSTRGLMAALAVKPIDGLKISVAWERVTSKYYANTNPSIAASTLNGNTVPAIASQQNLNPVALTYMPAYATVIDSVTGLPQTIQVGYLSYNIDKALHSDNWGVGVDYKTGNWYVSGAYSHRGTTKGRGADDIQDGGWAAKVEATYNLTKQTKILSGIQYAKSDDGAAQRSSAGGSGHFGSQTPSTAGQGNLGASRWTYMLGLRTDF